ncbi:MAG: polyphenol oxidase family protein, partial [Marinicella sp.]
PGVICSVMTADCLPILLTDQMGSFVAAVHCGWRGLYANIIAETVNAINSHNEIIAWLGPCIQAAQYEVDEEFKNHYLKQHPNVGHAFSPLIKGKCQADLYQLASIQLHKLDIKNLTQSNQCTFLNADYYSWRENQTAARMASMAWLTTDSIPA